MIRSPMGKSNVEVELDSEAVVYAIDKECSFRMVET